MIDELKRKRLKNQVIDKVEKQVSSYRPFENIIDVYVDMLMQQEELENQIATYSGSQDGKRVLTDISRDLKGDIKQYQEELLI